MQNISGRIDIKQRLQLAIARSRLRKNPLALLFIDLDRFNTITATLGPGFGQQFLDITTDRLSHALQGDHQLMHLGSDEYAVLIEGVDNSSQLRQLGNRLLNVINKPVFIEQQELITTASVGISIYPNKADNEQSLFTRRLRHYNRLKQSVAIASSSLLATIPIIPR